MHSFTMILKHSARVSRATKTPVTATLSAKSPAGNVTGRLKKSSGNHISILRASRKDAVVPVCMKFLSPQLHLCHLFVRNLDSFGIQIRIQFALHSQAVVGRRGGDEVDDDLVIHQRLAPPVLTDRREEAVLNLVPLAGARRKMADGDV